MTSIRKTKKVLKNSKGSSIVITKHGHLASTIDEYNYVTSSKLCAIINDEIMGIPPEAIPYKDIKRVIKRNYQKELPTLKLANKEYSNFK